MLSNSSPRERVRCGGAFLGEIESLLHWLEPRPGENLCRQAPYTPSAGAALCEIQQNSDVTYRLYDYGRPRELHLDQSLQVADLGRHPGLTLPVELGDGRRLLVECPYFRTESMELTGGQSHAGGPQAEFLICLEGRGQFGDEEFVPGQVWIVPAKTPPFVIQPRGRARLLRTFVPPSSV